MDESEQTGRDLAWIPDEEEAARRLRRHPKIPALARCARCGSADLTPLPYFSAGSGTVFRPDSDDAICRRCGNISPPELADS